MRSLILMTMAALLVGPAVAQNHEMATAQEPAPADTPVAKPEPKAAADAKKDKEEFKIPPGYKAKKRGDLTIYCRRDTTIGTRFAVEKCYSEEQLAEIERQNDDSVERVDQSRRVCTSQGFCGSN